MTATHLLPPAASPPLSSGVSTSPTIPATQNSPSGLHVDAKMEAPNDVGSFQRNHEQCREESRTTLIQQGHCKVHIQYTQTDILQASTKEIPFTLKLHRTPEVVGDLSAAFAHCCAWSRLDKAEHSYDNVALSNWIELACKKVTKRQSSLRTCKFTKHSLGIWHGRSYINCRRVSDRVIQRN
jgi:hypothetical protein